jgi:phosphoribosylanthranilate isomerase
MTFIKICGITSLDDALAAVTAGADALGFNFYQPSPRYIEPRAASEIVEQLPASILAVGVFVNEDSPQQLLNIAREAGVKALQLHGDEAPEYCRQLATGMQVIKTFAVSDDFDTNLVETYEVDAIMLDTKHNRLRGGTGRVFDWSIARQVSPRVAKLYLAGGLSPENVGEAIELVRPFAVDACSGLEERPGLKNHERVRAFVEAVRGVKP